LLVLVIAQDVESPSAVAFERAARRALGGDAVVRLIEVAADPPDEETVARGAQSDGVVELGWSGDGTQASIHCYLTREARWVDRQISFGAGSASSEREAAERGRFLGFAVATMFNEEAPAPGPARDTREAPEPRPSTTATPPDARSGTLLAPPRDAARRALEFAGIASTGIRGTAAGLGATAGLRFAWTGPLWARLFVAGRAGNIPEAQASTRTVHLGAGLAMSLLSPEQQLELGLRLDAFGSYFEATHFSEDDVVPDRQSRWLPGATVAAEVGYRFTGNLAAYASGGLEAVLGHTEIYTHGSQVAVVPPLRGVLELGMRTLF
jgi:hypothetical protein